MVLYKIPNNAGYVIREHLIIPNLPLPRRRESSNFSRLWIPVFSGMIFLEVPINIRRLRFICRDTNEYRVFNVFIRLEKDKKQKGPTSPLADRSSWFALVTTIYPFPPLKMSNCCLLRFTSLLLRSVITNGVYNIRIGESKGIMEVKVKAGIT